MTPLVSIPNFSDAQDQQADMDDLAACLPGSDTSQSMQIFTGTLAFLECIAST